MAERAFLSEELEKRRIDDVFCRSVLHLQRPRVLTSRFGFFDDHNRRKWLCHAVGKRSSCQYFRCGLAAQHGFLSAFCDHCLLLSQTDSFAVEPVGYSVPLAAWAAAYEGPSGCLEFNRG